MLDESIFGTKTEQLKQEYVDLKFAESVYRSHAKTKLEELRASCDHSGILFYCEYQEGILFGPDGPRMMCSVCGLEEDKWKVGIFNAKLPYENDPKVKLRIVKLSRDEFYRERI